MRTELDTGTTDLLGHIEDGVGVVTFNRPDRRNALSDAMYAAFGRVLPVLAADRDVRVVMVTGAGGAFCAGGDVKSMHEGATSEGGGGRKASTQDAVFGLRRSQRSVSLALHEMPKPVVAALPGAAAGAGMSIALSADIRLAAERAIIVPAFVDIGGSGDFGGTWFLTQIVGTAKARELYFTSPRLSSADALAMGLVNQVLPDDGFEKAALDYCKAIAAKPPIAVQYIKENLNRALTSDLATALDAEAASMVLALGTADHREAAAAFVEKRQGVYKGE